MNTPRFDKVVAEAQKPETDLEFVERMRLSLFRGLIPQARETERLIYGYETAALIVEHRMGVHPFQGMWEISTFYEDQAAKSTSLDTAVRAVAAKIQEWK
jgi:hypothetical protein